MVIAIVLPFVLLIEPLDEVKVNGQRLNYVVFDRRSRGRSSI